MSGIKVSADMLRRTKAAFSAPPADIDLNLDV